MRSCSFVVPLIVVVVGACGKTAKLDGEKPSPRVAEVVAATSGELRVEMERSECYGTCPAYTLAIAGDGSVTFNGKTFAAVRGKKTWTIPHADVEALARRIDAAGFFTLAWQDPCDVIATDTATVTLTLVYAGKNRTIAHDLGNRCMPAALAELENDVDRVARDAPFTRGDASAY